MRIVVWAEISGASTCVKEGVKSVPERGDSTQD